MPLQTTLVDITIAKFFVILSLAHSWLFPCVAIKLTKYTQCQCLERQAALLPRSRFLLRHDKGVESLGRLRSVHLCQDKFKPSACNVEE